MSSIHARGTAPQRSSRAHPFKLLSQLSFPVYAGQVVFRAAHQQTTTWSLAIGRRFAHFFVRPVMFCHVLFGTFSRFAWSPLERQDTADGGPLSPLFCLWVSVTEGPVVPVRETSTRNRRRNGVDERVGGSAREGVFARCQLRQVERWPRGAATRPAICLPVGALRSGGGAAGEGKSAVALSHDGRMGCFSLASIIDGPTGFGTGRRRHDRRRRYRRVDETQSEGPHQLALF